MSLRAKRSVAWQSLLRLSQSLTLLHNDSAGKTWQSLYIKPRKFLIVGFIYTLYIFV